MGGLARICRAYGGMKVTGNDGTAINYVWDYVADQAVPDTEMPRGSARHRASEKRRYNDMRRQATTPAPEGSDYG